MLKLNPKPGMFDGVSIAILKAHAGVYQAASHRHRAFFGTEPTTLQKQRQRSQSRNDETQGYSMHASTSRYHEVYARWQRDPLEFWGEAAR